VRDDEPGDGRKGRTRQGQGKRKEEKRKVTVKIDFDGIVGRGHPACPWKRMI